MPGRRTFFFDGLGVSEGIAIGPAYVLDSKSYHRESYALSDEDVEREVERFQRAVQLAKDDVQSIGRQVAEKIDKQQALIFDAHFAMLEDPYLIERTIDRIREEKRNAESIFWAVTKGLGDQLMTLGDEYFSERNHDLYDVARRVIKFMGEISTGGIVTPREGSIVVSSDLGPAETAQFSRDHAIGFATNEGGPTSHTAIMARALGIPAVVGLEYVTHYIRSGDQLIIDGTAGKLILNPSRDQIEYYQAKRQDFEAARVELAKLRSLPALTTDGVRVTLMANLELPDEVEAADENGAEGIGLFRTEFLYLDPRQTSAPNELEHFRHYRDVLDHMGDRPVVIRTMDIGGDKLSRQWGSPPELNPFLGLRAIRLCLANLDLFRAQLRAMLAAGAGRVLHIMLPMVCCLDEVRASRALMEECLEEMRSRGEAVPLDVKLGVMVEIPSVALLAREFAREVDFFSIGTNDLVQYTLAVDRVNKAVASLYQPTHPAILRLIHMVAEAGREAGICVSVCGEMASRPNLAVLLLGLGIDHLSMSPNSLNVVKRAIRSVSAAHARQLARDVLALSTAEEVDRHLAQGLGQIFAMNREQAAHATGSATTGASS